MASSARRHPMDGSSSYKSCAVRHCRSCSRRLARSHSCHWSRRIRLTALLSSIWRGRSAARWALPSSRQHSSTVKNFTSNVLENRLRNSRSKRSSASHNSQPALRLTLDHPDLQVRRRPQFSISSSRSKRMCLRLMTSRLRWPWHSRSCFS